MSLPEIPENIAAQVSALVQQLQAGGAQQDAVNASGSHALAPGPDVNMLQQFLGPVPHLLQDSYAAARLPTQRDMQMEEFGSSQVVPDPGPQPGGDKRCNCKKAKCLKLYCVCFSAGVYCNDCSCRECLNTSRHQKVILTERQKVLQRSPFAFSPKVEQFVSGDVLHKKGCRCRKSRCLKKYCECYDANVFCSGNCKCEGCHNKPSDEGFPREDSAAYEEDDSRCQQDRSESRNHATGSRQQKEERPLMDFPPMADTPCIDPLIAELAPTCSLQRSGSFNGGLWSLSYGGCSQAGSLAPSPISMKHNGRHGAGSQHDLVLPALTGHLRSHVLEPLSMNNTIGQQTGAAPPANASVGGPVQQPAEQQQQQQQEPQHDLAFINDSPGDGAHQVGVHLLLRPEVLVREPECALVLAQHIGLDETHQAAAFKAATVLRQMIHAAMKHPTFRGHELPLEQDFALSMGLPDRLEPAVDLPDGWPSAAPVPMPVRSTATGHAKTPDTMATAAGPMRGAMMGVFRSPFKGGRVAGASASLWPTAGCIRPSPFKNARAGGGTPGSAAVGALWPPAASVASAAAAAATPVSGTGTATTGNGLKAALRLNSGTFKIGGSATARTSDPGSAHANPEGKHGLIMPLRKATSLPVPSPGAANTPELDFFKTLPQQQQHQPPQQQQQHTTASGVAPLSQVASLPSPLPSLSQVPQGKRSVRAAKGWAPSPGGTMPSISPAGSPCGGKASSKQALPQDSGASPAKAVSGEPSCLSGRFRGAKRTWSHRSEQGDDSSMQDVSKLEVSSGPDHQLLKRALTAALPSIPRGSCSPQSRTHSPAAERRSRRAAVLARRQGGGSSCWGKVNNLTLDSVNEMEVAQALFDLRGGE